MAVKGVTVRFEEEMLKKINYVADYEGRSLNSHVLALVRLDIARHENEHGKIEGVIKPEYNLKPVKKGVLNEQ